MRVPGVLIAGAWVACRCFCRIRLLSCGVSPLHLFPWRSGAAGHERRAGAERAGGRARRQGRHPRLLARRVRAVSTDAYNWGAVCILRFVCTEQLSHRRVRAVSGPWGVALLCTGTRARAPACPSFTPCLPLPAPLLPLFANRLVLGDIIISINGALCSAAAAAAKREPGEPEHVMLQTRRRTCLTLV